MANFGGILEPDDLVSTGRAAKLCAVTRDTVLKWIKTGKINAVQTPGGHYRIKLECLKPFMSASLKKEAATVPSGASAASYCWEYHAVEGEVKSDCRKCLVYRSRTRKCYMLAERDETGACSASFHRGSCFECEYFQASERIGINVLVMTDSELLRSRLEADEGEGLRLRFSRCEYETSEVLREFVPHFVVLDFSKIHCNAGELREHLAKSPRISGMQIVVTLPGDREGETPWKSVSAALAIPGDVVGARECIFEAKRMAPGAGSQEATGGGEGVG